MTASCETSVSPLVKSCQGDDPTDGAFMLTEGGEDRLELVGGSRLAAHGDLDLPGGDDVEPGVLRALLDEAGLRGIRSSLEEVADLGEVFGSDPAEDGEFGQAGEDGF